MHNIKSDAARRDETEAERGESPGLPLLVTSLSLSLSQTLSRSSTHARDGEMMGKFAQLHSCPFLTLNESLSYKEQSHKVKKTATDCREKETRRRIMTPGQEKGREGRQKRGKAQA